MGEKEGFFDKLFGIKSNDNENSKESKDTIAQSHSNRAPISQTAETANKSPVTSVQSSQQISRPGFPTGVSPENTGVNTPRFATTTQTPSQKSLKPASSQTYFPSQQMAATARPATQQMSVPMHVSGAPGKAQSEEYDINDLLALVVEKGGSDLHLTVGSPPMMRIQGRLWPTDLPPLEPKDTKRLVYQFLTNEQRERFERDLELDISYEIPKVSRFRCNIFLNRLGVGAVFRVIPTKIKTLAELKMPPVLAELARRNKGLVLVTGPTGSGKSTTLAAMIDLINNERQEHILTIEDPIEFVHQHKKCIINQREVGPNTKSFANALRAALREDPNVILVGEMRDYETIALAVTAAETGHLVLATLHTPSAAQSVDRIIDVFPAHQQEQIRVQLADSLQGIIAQQLIPTIDGMSRVVALEILINTPAVANLIRENKTFQIPSIMQTSKQLGMQTMDQALMDLVKSRRISPEEAYRRAFDKKAFEQYKPKC